MHTRKIKLGIKVLLLLSITYIAVIALTEAIYYFLVPSEYFGLYPAIGAFYLVTGIISYYLMVHYRNTSHDKLLNVHMYGRIIKLFLTIFFLIIYIYLVEPQNKKAFALTTITNYFVFAGVELYIFSLFNKRLTKHENKHKEHH